MPMYWVNIERTFTWNIPVEASTLKAAETWARKFGLDYVYCKKSDDDARVMTTIKSVYEMDKFDAKDYKNNVDICI